MKYPEKGKLYSTESIFVCLLKWIQADNMRLSYYWMAPLFKVHFSSSHPGDTWKRYILPLEDCDQYACYLLCSFPIQWKKVFPSSTSNRHSREGSFFVLLVFVISQTPLFFLMKNNIFQTKQVGQSPDISLPDTTPQSRTKKKKKKRDLVKDIHTPLYLQSHLHSPPTVFFPSTMPVKFIAELWPELDLCNFKSVFLKPKLFH